MSIIEAACASCGAVLGPAADACPTCGEIAPTTRRSLFRVATDAVAPRAASRRDVAGEAGSVLITARDFMVLDELARLRLPSDDPIARGLIKKLERSQVVPPDAVAAGVVTLDSRVVFSIDGGEAEARVLVHPDAHTVSGWSLPVTTPRGLAMLGLRAGATTTAERRSGGVERIDILSVAYQPEEAARRRRVTAADAGVVAALPTLLRRPVRLRNPGRPHDDDPPPSAA